MQNNRALIAVPNWAPTHCCRVLLVFLQRPVNPMIAFKQRLPPLLNMVCSASMQDIDVQRHRSHLCRIGAPGVVHRGPLLRVVESGGKVGRLGCRASFGHKSLKGKKEIVLCLQSAALRRPHTAGEGGKARQLENPTSPPSKPAATSIQADAATPNDDSGIYVSFAPHCRLAGALGRSPHSKQHN